MLQKFKKNFKMLHNKKIEKQNATLSHNLKK